MKKFFGIALIALFGLSVPALAQDTKDKVKQDAKKAWSGTKKGAKKVGNKSAELSSKGWSNVKDKKSDTWVGPDGQTIYVTDDSKYYWVNGKGKRIFVNEDGLKAKNQ